MIDEQQDTYEPPAEESPWLTLEYWVGVHDDGGVEKVAIDSHRRTRHVWKEK